MFSPINISRYATLANNVLPFSPIKRRIALTTTKLYRQLAYPPMPKRYGSAITYGRSYKRRKYLRRAVPAKVAAIAAYYRRGGAKYVRSRLNRKKSFRYAQVRTIGERVGTSRCRSVQTSSLSASYDTQTLNTVPLIQNLFEGTGNNQRMRDLINVRGFKMYLEITAGENSRMLYVNLAVLHNKVDAQSIDTQDFWRDNESDRAIAFDALGVDALRRYTGQINTDKYAVLWRTRFRINSANATTGVSQFPNIPVSKVIVKYLPLKRQIRYQDQDTNEVPIDQVYLCWWCDQYAEESNTVLPEALVMNFRNIMYFRNTRD